MFRHLRLRLPRNIRTYYTVKSEIAHKDKDVIAKHIYSQIKIGGPISVAEYMRQVLTHPLGGYYIHKDMFGEGGDFVTSPELGQIFGEMIAVWFLNEWSKVGSPKPFQIVELGPGRGSLCQDILRVFSHFGALNGASVHLVEISPLLSDLQARKLCVKSINVNDDQATFYRDGTSFEGVNIRWYKTLKDVPNGFTLLIAHEFFDALPIHKFKKTERGFREVLIDIDTNKPEQNFRYVLARDETPVQKLFLNPNDPRQDIEVCPDALVQVKDIAERMESDGGLALIADYGHDGDGTDTFRAYKKHKQHDPLVEPGTADLTADVDFAMLKKAALQGDRVLAFGPTTQRNFLMNMGIEHRVKKLEECITEEQKKYLHGGFHMMTDEDKMGARFKFLALVPAVLKKILEKVPVVGFN